MIPEISNLAQGFGPFLPPKYANLLLTYNEASQGLASHASVSSGFLFTKIALFKELSMILGIWIQTGE